MKRFLALLMVVVLGVSLCACGGSEQSEPKYVKSEAAKNVEKQINTLSASSSYQEIYDVYSLYKELSYDDKENLENKDTLSQYCELATGHFILTSEMLDEIEVKFEMTSLEMTGVEFSVMYGIVKYNSIAEYSDYHEPVGDYVSYTISSHEISDEYTYAIHGTAKVKDAYGYVSTIKYDLEYFAEYDEETNTYTIDSDFNIVN